MEWITQDFRRVIPARAAESKSAMFVLFSLAAVCLALQPKAGLAQSCIGLGGWVESVEGDMTISGLATQMGDKFCLGDEVVVGQRSRAAIRLAETQTVVRVNENSTFAVEESDNGGPLLKLLKGVLYLFSRHPQNLSVEAPYINAAIDGTEFVIETSAQRSEVTVIEGNVRVSNASGNVRISPGESVNVGIDRVPQRRTVVDPLNAVQWALYYPPIGAAENTSDTARSAAESLARGDVESAEFALAASRNDAASHALRSIIAVTRNQSDEAMELARRAVNLDAGSSLAYSALSYAQQAQFDIDQALASAIVAVQNDSDNADALARQAELQLGVDQTADAYASAREAVRVDSKNSRARTILGFVNLLRLDVRKAKADFSDAVVLSPGDPLPRLGLGLANIRDGQLVEGREHIEVAASLDPANALVRSYLGKAYFEERQTADASAQFALAKRLDTQDPTPWYYDAILKQSINRPVEALRDLQKSIELNDNRAVFRSRLLLDSDLAARNANLARIYDDLGFDQLALVEGWHSLNTDFNSFSGHRLLAETYSTLPRHEIARVSELLQSQLRQPLLLNPVQTQLIEPNLTILKGTAPFESSFNEYTSMFVRNGPRVQLGGIAGDNGTFGEEIILSGVYNKFSGSINQYRFKTDGVRNNGDQDQRIGTLFVQHAATPQFNLQLESRYTSVDRGDLFLRFDPQNFLADLREREEDSSIRLGARYQFTPDSNVIANVKYSEATVDLDIGGADDSDVEADGAQIEFQNLIRSEKAQHISGFGYFKRDRLDVDAEEDGSLTSTEFNTEHANLYHYSLIEFPQNLTWTLGASAESFQEGDSSEKQLNPKLGIVWRPATGTTVRAAGFTTFTRALLSQQTVEPTSVAGFNQFFDDGEGTDANRYGIAIDQVFSSSVYGGVELSKRSIKTPGQIFDRGVPSIAINSSNEELLSAYLYWTLNKSVAFSAAYQKERLDRDSNFIGPEEVSALDTDRLTLGLSYFHSTNFRFKFSPTYVNQSGSFAEADFSGDTFSDGDNFWVVDMEFGYRLTKYNGYINLVAKNVLDQKFRFQDTDPEHPNILPGRFLFGALSLSF